MSLFWVNSISTYVYRNIVRALSWYGQLVSHVDIFDIRQYLVDGRWCCLFEAYVIYYLHIGVSFIDDCGLF